MWHMYNFIISLYCVYKQSSCCWLPFCDSLIFPLKFKDFFHLLVSSLFVLSNVIYSRGYCRFVHMYKAIVYYSIVLCCGMYEGHCLACKKL
jgi:hypothetical protein